MAEFKVEVHRLTIEEHPNADALELAVIGGYHSIVRKGDFKTGELAVYIPEQALVPEWLIKEMGLEGRLAGKAHNRVKAVKLRKHLSQGLVYAAREAGISNFVAAMGDDGVLHRHAVHEGQDVTELLGITKWEPKMPSAMNGKCWNAMGRTVHYDIENWKRYPTILEDREEVVFTEKIHGTWCCFGKSGDDYIVTSKGLSDRGLAFVLDEDNANNIYVRHFLEYGGKEILDMFMHITGHEDCYILGELFGPIQDLKYGLGNKPAFRIFDIYIGNTSGRGTRGNYYYSPTMMGVIVKDINILNAQRGIDVVAETVPELYRGPFSEAVMNEYTNGMETVSGNEEHIREGIVMNPVKERDSSEIGRVILKSVSEAYLLRKGKKGEEVTEFN